MTLTSGKVLLTRKALVLAKPEATFNVDPIPTPADNSVLVSDPDYAIDANVLERNFVTESLSPLGVRTGRKLASLSFGVEVRSNGLTNSGSTNDACKFGTLLRACGYSETGMTGSGTVSAVYATPTNDEAVTWAVGGAHAGNVNLSNFTVTCVLGGATTVAELRVTGGSNVEDTSVLHSEEVTATVYRNDTTAPTVTATVDASDPLAVDITIVGFAVGDIVRADVNGFRYEHTVVGGDTDATGIANALAALIDVHALIAASNTIGVVNITYTGAGDGAAITSGTTAVTLGDTGMDITPTWSNNLVLGESWEVTVYPVGILYQPVSSNFESMTLYAYFDDLLHKMTGSYGTFSIEANAGEYATANFTFTGQYVVPTDAVTPTTSVFESTIPPIVELAQLRLKNIICPVSASFTYDQNNTIVPRLDVCGSDGFSGTQLVSRAPEGGLDPEATLIRNYNFWDDFSESTEFFFSMRIGTEAGNSVLFNAPRVQYTGLTYQDRDGTRVFDAGLRFSRRSGDDEFEIVTA